MNFRLLLLLGALTLAFAACDDDEDDMMPCTVEGGTLTGGPFVFTKDGLPDEIGDLSLEGAVGTEMAYLVTDPDGLILGIQPSIAELQKVDFDGNELGTCLIYHLSFQRGVLFADVGQNLSDITGCHALSNSVEVNRNPCGAEGGSLPEDSFAFEIDEDDDFLPAASLELSNTVGDTINYVLTSADSTIVAVFPDADSLTRVNFDALASGDYLVWGLARTTPLENAVPGTKAIDVLGCFGLSNPVPVAVVCPADGGTLVGGPFVFDIDGESDFVDEDSLTLDGAVGVNTTYVVTDNDGVILALPGDFDALQEVDFNSAGEGRCLIWHLSFNGPLTGAGIGANAADLGGCFDLSNPVIVQRQCTAAGGRLSGGPFTVVADSSASPTVIDTSFIALTGAVGESTTYVVTDVDGIILSLPATLGELAEVDFAVAEPGTCLIWHLSYNGPLTGADVGADATALQGCWSLSNSLTVTKTEP